MNKVEIKQLFQSSIDTNRIIAKQVSIENLKKIIQEFELNLDEFNYKDVKDNYNVFREELELKLIKL
jgi:hypothetical protein